jgi:hypothetical protein
MKTTFGRVGVVNSTQRLPSQWEHLFRNQEETYKILCVIFHNLVFVHNWIKKKKIRYGTFSASCLAAGELNVLWSHTTFVFNFSIFWAEGLWNTALWQHKRCEYFLFQSISCCGHRIYSSYYPNQFIYLKLRKPEYFLWDFTFSPRQVWCSEIFGMYCHVK